MDNTISLSISHPVIAWPHPHLVIARPKAVAIHAGVPAPLPWIAASLRSSQ